MVFSLKAIALWPGADRWVQVSVSRPFLPILCQLGSMMFALVVIPPTDFTSACQ